MEQFSLLKILIVLILEISIVKSSKLSHLHVLSNGKNKNVEPCNNFYNHVCGCLSKNTASDKWNSHKITTSQLYYKIQDIYINHKNTYPKLNTKRKLKMDLEMDIAWLDACINSDASKRKNKLKDYIKNFETCSEGQCLDQTNWQTIESGFAALRGKSTFFQIEYKGAKGFMVEIPEEGYVFDQFINSENSVIDAFMSEFVEEFRPNTEVSTAEELQEFHEDLLEIFDLEVKDYQWMSLEMFQEKVLNYLLNEDLEKINWMPIFNAMFKDTELELSPLPIQFRLNMEFWNKLNLLLSETPNDIIVNYIYLVTILNDRIEWYNKASLEDSQNLFNECLRKSPIINGLLSEIANTEEMREKKEYVSWMFEEIKKQYKIEFESSGMNSKLKTLLQKTVGEIELYFPNFVKTIDNKHITDNQLSYDFEVGDNIVENLFNFEKAQLKVTVEGFLKMRNLKNPLNIDLSAFYSTISNTLTVPKERLFSLFIDVDSPISVNYGSMGFTLGHEINHGVIDKVREFLKNDTNNTYGSTKDMYDAYTKCLIDQLDKLGVNGEKTLDESLADAFGVQIAYKTLERIICKDANIDEKVTELDCKHWRRLFFISLPTFYCEHPVEKDYDGDIYPPTPIRINQIASNLDEFNKVFGCSKDHTLFRVDKCQFWFDELDDQELH